MIRIAAALVALAALVTLAVIPWSPLTLLGLLVLYFGAGAYAIFHA